MHVLPVPLSLVTGISALRISVPPDLRETEPRQAVLDTVRGGGSGFLLGFEGVTVGRIADHGARCPGPRSRSSTLGFARGRAAPGRAGHRAGRG